MGFLRNAMLGTHLKVSRIIKVNNVLHSVDTTSSSFFKSSVSNVRHAQVLPAPGIAVCSVEVSIFIKYWVRGMISLSSLLHNLMYGGQSPKWLITILSSWHLCPSVVSSYMCQSCSMWPTAYGRGDSMWFLWLGHNKLWVFLPFRLFVLGETSHHVVRKLKQFSEEAHVRNNWGLPLIPALTFQPLEWTILRANHARSGSGKSSRLQMMTALADILIVTSWETSGQNHPTELPPNFWHIGTMRDNKCL